MFSFCYCKPNVSHELQAASVCSLFFFFSSRRRHTRFKCDWSSDVCSSDVLSPVEGGGSGLGPDALSAYSEYAFEMLRPLADEAGGTDQMFPGGNTTIARLMVKSLIPAALDGPNTVDGGTRNNVNFAALDAATSPATMRLSSTPVSVQHDGDPQKASSLSIAY